MNDAAPPSAPSPGPGPRARAFWQRLKERPGDFDLFFALRLLQAREPASPRLGRALRPRAEAIRLGQDPSLSFAPTTLAEVLPPPARAPHVPERLTVWSFGLYGPNGPLPTHLTEYVRERLRQHDDPTLARFADIFHHRLLLLFFRAWADAQPTVSLDRPGTDDFGRFLGSLLGYGEEALQGRDAVPDHAKRFAAGHWSRWTRNPEGLASALHLFLGVPVQLQEHRLHRLPLAAAQQTCLVAFGGNTQLGVDAVVGARVPDAQYAFRLRLGPMPLDAYQRLLPGGEDFPALVDWVRNYVGIEYAWDLQLVLRQPDVRGATLGGRARLGLDSWMLAGPAAADADDFAFDAERWLRGRRRPPRAPSPTPTA
ncbi:MAG: type VI secretion protein [Rubrivivax sp. SCN 71-131]|jgi:type VI secretion system protein ImpH|nr:MAG: type VI secretion protein [Rubrivivax sp. SCN 71-131]